MHPAGRRVSRDTARDGRSRRAHRAWPVVRACRASARHRGVGAKSVWLLCAFKVTRRKAGTLSGRCRSNGYVQKILSHQEHPSPRLSRRRGNQLGDADDIRCPVCCATARRRRRGGHSYKMNCRLFRGWRAGCGAAVAGFSGCLATAPGSARWRPGCIGGWFWLFLAALCLARSSADEPLAGLHGCGPG